MSDADLKAAEDYAEVEFIGLNAHGERMYQAADFYNLSRRDSKIPAFLAGIKHERERMKLSEFEEVLNAFIVHYGLRESASPLSKLLVEHYERLTKGSSDG